MNTCVEVTVTYRIDTDDELPEDFNPDELADTFAGELARHIDFTFDAGTTNDNGDETWTDWAADRWTYDARTLRS